MPSRPPEADPDVMAGHVAWALRIAANHARRFPALADELESAALVGLAEAWAAYDPARRVDGRPVKFRTFALLRVRGAIIDAMRDWSPRGFAHERQRAKHGPAPAVHSLATDDPADNSPFDVPSGDLPVGWEAEYQDEIEGLARLLPAMYRPSFVPHYTRADCRSQRETARAVGLSECRISQLLMFSHRFLSGALLNTGA